MPYRVFLFLSVLVAGILGMSKPAPAYYETDTYNLERADINGYVLAVENQVAYIQTDYGDEIAVQLGPESYWNAHHYYLPEGQYIEMEVWYDPTDRYTEWYFAGEIWGPGFHFVLTNNVGVPLWVIFADDYYYSMGYHASCVSYMIWFDCPPVYFIYLVLPPPPPPTYLCYYGPHWRNHHADWHYGPRYGRGGSYWHDGQGHERPGRRSGDQPRDNDRWGGRNSGGNPAVTTGNVDLRPSPSTPPVVRAQPQTYKLQRQPVKSQQIYDRKGATPRKDTRKKDVTSKPQAERKVYAPTSESQQRQIQPPSSNQVKQDVRSLSDVRRDAPSVKSKPQNSQQSRTSKSEKTGSAVDRDKDIAKVKR
jgi:hypothetical protein